MFSQTARVYILVVSYTKYLCELNLSELLSKQGEGRVQLVNSFIQIISIE